MNTRQQRGDGQEGGQHKHRLELSALLITGSPSLSNQGGESFAEHFQVSNNSKLSQPGKAALKPFKGEK